jgi:hypothetical protein
MTLTGHPHVGDVHLIRVTVTSDGSTAVPLVGPVIFRLLKPDGTSVDVDADLTTDGADGRAEYETTEDDFNIAGYWKLQVKDDDGPWHGDVTHFLVLGNLAEPV